MQIKQVSGRYADIAMRLRIVRAYFEMQQKDFAEAAGVKQKSYSQWESGGFRISIQGAIKLRKRYGVSLDFIYVGSIDALPTKMSNALASMLRDSTGKTPKDDGET